MTTDGLREEGIPPDVLPKAREWWARQMQQLARSHGSKWPEHRQWLADYLNEEVRERLAKRMTT